jgi:predicted nucleic acid-binding protein
LTADCIKNIFPERSAAFWTTLKAGTQGSRNPESRTFQRAALHKESILRVVIDTNVLVSAVISRDAKQLEQAERLFRLAAESKAELLIPQSCIFEFMDVMEHVYELAGHAILPIVRDLVGVPNLRVVDELPLILWFRTWTHTISDPNDAAVATVALSTHSSVATFDRKLMGRLRSLSVDVWTWADDKSGDTDRN